MRRTRFLIMSVPFTINDTSWQFIPPKLLMGLVTAFLVHQSESIANNIMTGLLYGVMLNLVLLLHIIGHIISSQFVAPPMTEARITPTLIQTRYDNDSDLIAPKAHIIRSLGGPVMNLLLGIVFYLVWIASEHPIALFLVGTNWVFMIIVLLPFPTVDGGVIWREIYRMWRQSNA